VKAVLLNPFCSYLFSSSSCAVLHFPSRRMLTTAPLSNFSYAYIFHSHPSQDTWKGCVLGSSLFAFFYPPLEGVAFTSLFLVFALFSCCFFPFSQSFSPRVNSCCSNHWRVPFMSPLKTSVFHAFSWIRPGPLSLLWCFLCLSSFQLFFPGFSSRL